MPILVDSRHAVKFITEKFVIDIFKFQGNMATSPTTRSFELDATNRNVAFVSEGHIVRNLTYPNLVATALVADINEKTHPSYNHSQSIPLVPPVVLQNQNEGKPKKSYRLKKKTSSSEKNAGIDKLVLAEKMSGADKKKSKNSSAKHVQSDSVCLFFITHY